MSAWRATILLAVGLAGCGGAPPEPPVNLPKPSAVAPVVTSRGVTVVMENEEAAAIVGNRQAPYINSLLARGGLAARSYGIRHPSLPNYLALTSGATHGMRSDCTSCHVGARSIADQLEAAGLRWRAYMEDLPRP